MPRNPVLRVILCISAAALLAALLASYGGRLHPLGDSLAVFRPAMALLLALIAFAFRCWWRIALLASALFAAAPILWLMRPQSAPAPSVTVYQKNLLFRRDDPAELLAELRASNADVILLEEVSTANLPIPEALRDRYRFQIICPAHSVGAVAILSVHPMSDEYCREGAGFTIARIAHPAGAFTAVAVHLYWPYPFGQEPQVNNILADLAGINKDELHIELDRKRIKIAGVRKIISVFKNTRYRQAEIPHGYFARNIILPAFVDAESANATYADGILMIRINKQKEHKMHRIQITSPE